MPVPESFGHQGAFKVVSELGRGGFATVYKAYQASLDRYVAIKVLRPEIVQDETGIQRFQREARAAARLGGHPNIVTIYDYGEQDGLAYLALEFIDGATLQEKLAQPISASEVDHIVSGVASALDFAHSHQLVHRDVKPSNVLLGKDGRVVLSDFGIAKLLDAATSLTGAAIGTPEYMAPEQITGGAVDGRSDIYSLGVMVYRIFAGKPPFQGTLMSVLHRHVHEPPPTIAEAGRRIPAGVQEVVSRALEKDPARRYPSSGALAEALSETLGAAILAERARVALGAGDLDRADRLANQVLAEHPEDQEGRYVHHEVVRRRQLVQANAAIARLLDGGDWRTALAEIQRLRLRELGDAQALLLVRRADEAYAAEAARMEAARRRAEQERLERETREREAQESFEREARERQARERAERERMQREALERDERERLEREARERAEQERIEREALALAERERQDRLAREKAEQDRLEREAQALAERERQDRLAKERAERERQELVAREQAEEAARALAERERQEREARERAERAVRERAERTRMERERQAAAESTVAAVEDPATRMQVSRREGETIGIVAQPEQTAAVRRTPSRTRTPSGRPPIVWVGAAAIVALIGGVALASLNGLFDRGPSPSPTPQPTAIVPGAPSDKVRVATPGVGQPAAPPTAPPKVDPPPTSVPATLAPAPDSKPTAPPQPKPATAPPAQPTSPPPAQPTSAPPAATLPPRITGRDGVVMALVPEGDFFLGSDTDQSATPLHKLDLPAFYLDLVEIANAKFAVFAEQSGYKPQGDWRRYFDSDQIDKQHYDADRRDHPVVNVTWGDADAYCRWAGKRLPAEAEWEKAARGTDTRRWPWGNEPHPEYANVETRDESGREPDTMRVGSFPKGVSPNGTLDMTGNVWEWTSSPLLPYPLDPNTSSAAVPSATTPRVTRGASWLSLPERIEVTSRLAEPPNIARKDLGFRCASSADQAVRR